MRFLFLAACALSASALSARGANLLENGSFEQPVVTERTTEGNGGNPARISLNSAWASLIVDPGSEGGKLQVGLTNEIARTGKQSLFLDFDRVAARGRKAVLKTKPIAIKPSQQYRLSLWGRIDRKRPIALDERRPQMWLEVRFLQEDQTTETGEPIAGAQFLPGEIIPGGPHPLTFVSEKWKETSAQLTTPETARFVTITWYWLTTGDEGETDGTIYWDDASLDEAVPTPAAPEPGAASPTKDGASPATPDAGTPNQ
jgi:hypothetical protein